MMLFVATVFVPIVSGLRYGNDTTVDKIDGSIQGLGTSPHFGSSVAMVGDLNGDGYDDLAVGAPGITINSNAKAGAVYIFFGRATGWGINVSASTADVVYQGIHPDDQSGTDVSAAGDVNGDGYADLLISSMWDDDNSADSGKTYLILGKASVWISPSPLSSADASWVGENGGDLSGCSVDGAGDLNGDGYDDIVIGARGMDEGGIPNGNIGQVYIIFGRPTGWVSNSPLNGANASFIGEDYAGQVGAYVAGLGDVNGDGYDDVGFSSPYYSSYGVIYVKYGGPSGWAMDSLIKDTVEVRFRGEFDGDGAGNEFDGGNDVNGDGIDDIIIGAKMFKSGGLIKGKAYLVTGRTGGWAHHVTLDNSSSSFIGESSGDLLGGGVAMAGDVNGDGYGDFLLSATSYSGAHTQEGKVYLFLGKSTLWSNNGSVTVSDASFLGEGPNDMLSFFMDGGQDINGDGYNDIVFGTPYTDLPTTGAGKAYLVFPDQNNPPTFGGSPELTVYEDPGYTQNTGHIRIYDKAYLEVKATDVNATRMDTVIVNVTPDITLGTFIQVALRETGPNTGTFRGTITVKDHTSERKSWIGAIPGDTVVIKPFRATAPTGSFIVDWSLPTILPLMDNTTAVEDSLYNMTYTVFGGKPPFQWTINGTPWLKIIENGRSFTIYGTPSNNDVMTSTMNVGVSDSIGGYDSRTFTIQVANNPPVILNNGTFNATEDQPFLFDLNCSDDGQGNIIWSGIPPLNWLKLYLGTGIITGTPLEEDVGLHEFNISVSDGNGGVGKKTIVVNVKNVFEPPLITTIANLTLDELQQFTFQVNAIDTDRGVNLIYELDMAPAGMTINSSSGLISWVPDPSQGGNHSAVVNVSDGVAFATLSFNITVVIYPPTAALQLPMNGAIVPTQSPLLSWTTRDDNSPVVSVDIYLSTNRSLVDAYSTDALKARGALGGNFTVQGLLNVGQTYYWTVIPFDGNHTGKSLKGVYNFTVNGSIGNHKPMINGDPVTKAVAGSFYHYKVDAIDADGDTLFYNLMSYPPGMTIDNMTGDINWTPKSTDVGDHPVILQVWDRFVYAEQRYNITVSTAIVLHPPTVNTISAQKVTAGKRFIYQVVAYDQDAGDNLTYSLSGQPNGMTINAKTGLIEWKSGQNQVGKHTVQVQVSDGKFQTNVTLSIAVSKIAPVNFFTTPTFFIILLLIMVMVIAAIVAFVVVSRKKQRAKSEAEAQMQAQEKQAMATELQAVKTAAKEEKEMVEDFTVEGAFVIYQDGRLVARKATTEADIDDHLFSSMLIAIQGFVKESFRSESGLDSFEFGGRHVTLVKGRFLFLAVSLSGKEPHVLRERMRELVEKIEGTYAGVVECWDGDTSRFKDLDIMLTPLFTLRDELKVKKAQDEVRVMSSLEFYEGFVRLKVAVMNKTATTITDASLNLTYNRDALKFNKIEPEVDHEGTNVALGAVKPAEKKTVAYYMDPLICQESVVDCTLTYYDFKGEINHVNMKRRPVDIVCPIFYTAQTVNVAMLKRLLGDHQYRDSKIYRIGDAKTLGSVFGAAKEAVSAHSVKFVREFTDDESGDAEAWYFGEVQTSGEKMVIRVSSKVSMKFLEVFVASSNLATQTGLLAELGISINSRIKRFGIVEREVVLETSPDIKAVMERTQLLLDKYAESEAPAGETKLP